jgi:hypothetical protein
MRAAEDEGRPWFYNRDADPRPECQAVSLSPGFACFGWSWSREWPTNRPPGGGWS